jgi:cellulose synthase/poly-beta-1,6-N-acetylglucosamine synthase-like glycosyltransferase
MQYLFWISCFLVFFAYFGYPITLRLLALFLRKNYHREPITPSLTHIITAYNEERQIREKLENTVALDYPRENLQIIVASDGSTDATNSIVANYADRGVETLVVTDRKGKENAQAEAVKKARGEIIVFSDVATRLDPQGLREIIAPFADPAIGCVSSEDRMISDNTEDEDGEGFYVKYEMWLRKLESQVNSVVGLSGSFFAARKEVCSEFAPNMQSDFRTLLSSMKHGMRGIIEPNAVGYYQGINDSSREFHRKVRTVLRGLTVFFNHAEFLNIFTFGLFSYQYFCHKLMRWLVPFFLVTAFVSCGALVLDGIPPYLIAFEIQVFFYLAALAGIFIPPLTKIASIRIPSFFVVVNTSIFVAWCKFLKGERVVLWQPSVR